MTNFIYIYLIYKTGINSLGDYMTTYRLTLTPALRNVSAEGAMDTSILNGVSVQRTGYIDVFNSSGKRKIVEVVDGASFTDTPTTLADESFIE